MLRVGIVAGEASGDQLGAGLITAIKALVPDARFEGIAGPQMVAAGCKALYSSERLSVMGLVEVLGHLPELLSIRKNVRNHFLSNPPDVFIGVDAPDFNIPLEHTLRKAGIKTVHYVSPTVWAWRQKRIRKIAASVDLMLTVFPFEAAFYEKHQVPVRFVGHPLADLIPLVPDYKGARNRLGIADNQKLIALLPGSRRSEVARLGRNFLLAAKQCVERRPGLRFVVPLTSAATRAQFEQLRKQHSLEDLPLTVLEGHSRDAMAAADVVLVASGTASLEAMLLKRPMVVAYRLAPLTFFVLRRLLKVSHYALPNLLNGKATVQELIQGDATPERLADALLNLLDHPEQAAHLVETFTSIHESLRRGASAQAAQAVLNLVESTQSRE